MEMIPEEWDPLLDVSEPTTHWTTSNLGEAMPGVQTPLSWTMWRDAVERAPREAAFRIGALTSAERWLPPAARRVVRAFYGRPAVQVEFFAELGDRMPGTTGQATVESILGRAPETIDYRPTRRRYPVVGWKLATTFAVTPRRLRRFAAEQDAWYAAQIARVECADLVTCRAVLRDAASRHEQALIEQTTGIVSVIQPLHRTIEQLVGKLGAGDVSALTGPPGGAEMELVADLWKVSRGRLELADMVRRHGFHGPAEGELSSRVWREDDRPLRALVEGYRTSSDANDPQLADAARRRRHPGLERELIDAAPVVARPAVAMLLALARTRLCLRGVAKRSFLQAFDVARAAARRAGELLAADGVLDGPSDVFYLTREELIGGIPDDAPDLIVRRRERRLAYQAVSIPDAWRGTPAPTPNDQDDADEVTAVAGIGVSAGVVEGRARVIESPDFAEVEPGEILVAATTDPSWSSIMFLSEALVVDIGGALSHAAVIARELGIPCVVNTRNGTRRLRTGDRIRVDGTTGTVDILEPADRPTTPGAHGA